MSDEQPIFKLDMDDMRLFHLDDTPEGRKRREDHVEKCREHVRKCREKWGKSFPEMEQIRGLYALVMRCPQCRGHGSVRGPNKPLGDGTEQWTFEDCPTCTPIREWLWDELGVEVMQYT